VRERAKSGVFISYARADGEEFATRLRQRLERDATDVGVVWQDRSKLEGGIGWWKQIAEAIERSEFLALVMTPAAVQSEVVRREWLYARGEGVCVYPVIGAPGLNFDVLPRWMRKANFYDLEREWDKFIGHLRAGCRVDRVPFMAPDMPGTYVDRPEEFGALKALLLGGGTEPVAITTALRGAGGFGKTTLAAALCHDADVQTAFDDGILWVTLGEKPNLVASLTTAYAALTGERPGFANEEDGANELASKLEQKNCLLVIDDVWRPGDLRWFLRRNDGCARLITTRLAEAAPDSRQVLVDEMKPAESRALLGKAAGLAERLGNWPLMLEIVRANVEGLVKRGKSVENAVEYVSRALERKGAGFFHKESVEERHQSIAETITVSLKLLESDQKRRYQELAVFPEDTDVPLEALRDLWDLDEFDTEELARRLDGLSLLRLDLRTETVRLHDVVRNWLESQVSDVPAVHGRLVDAWWPGRYRLSAYGWRWLAYHLAGAGRDEDLRTLLLDFGWLQRKLEATEPQALTADFEYVSKSVELCRIQSMLRLSAHVLAADNKQLAGQLLGRLPEREAAGLEPLIEGARAWREVAWLCPLPGSLTAPGGPLVRSLVHGSEVKAVAISEDGRWAVSGAGRAVRVWDLESGREVWTLKGHTDAVHAVAMSGDGRRAVSGSRDRTLKVWDLKSGREEWTLKGHTGEVWSVAISRDGLRGVSGADDGTLKVWNLEIGREERTLDGQTFRVKAVAVSGDGRRAVSGSFGKTVTAWDLENGREEMRLEAHTREVKSVAVSGDGCRAILGPDGGKVAMWDLESGEAWPLEGHAGDILSVAVSGDGRRAVAGTSDGTVRAWDLESGQEDRRLEGHTGAVNGVAVSGDGQRAVSAAEDGTVKVWDLTSGRKELTVKGHVGRVNAVAVSRDGRRAVSGSDDETLKVWNPRIGVEERTFAWHRAPIRAVAVSGDGGQAVSGSLSQHVKVWDLESGRELRAHEGLEGFGHWVRAMAISADGGRAVTGSFGRIVKVWDLENGQEVWAREGSWGSVSVALSGDGRWAASGSESGVVMVWDLDGGQKERALQGHTSWVNAVAVSDGGNRVVSGSADRTVRVWDLESGRKRQPLEGHTREVTGVAVSGDGRRVVSASEDRTVRVWDAQTGKPVATYTLDGEATCCGVTVDGRIVVAGDATGAVHFLRLIEPDDPV
jgi:WD40 repeat protein